MKICHITSVHSRSDVRIFHKECRSLSDYFGELNLIVADGKGAEISGGVRIIDVGKPKGRFSRWLQVRKKILKAALSLNPDIVHFHDPELLSIAGKLLKNKIKVIYDVHEDVPRQIMTKHYIPYVFRQIIGSVFEKYENAQAKKMSYIITATPFLKKRFEKINKNTQDVNNFPLTKEFVVASPWQLREDSVCYIGGITKLRGIVELLKAVDKTGVKLHLAGTFEGKQLETQLKSGHLWQNVTDHGFVDRKGVAKILGLCKIGMVTLHPTLNYLDALPIKMFEYMAAGIPVICSDFPLWKDIVETHKCGLTVNPLSVDDISSAMMHILSNDNEAKEMGENGRNAVYEHFNWKKEAGKLVNVYKVLNAQS